MFNIDNILIFSMTFFGSLGIVYFIFFLIMDILAITIFRKVRVSLIDCQIYEIHSFLSDSFNAYSIYIKYNYIYQNTKYTSSRLNGYNVIATNKERAETMLKKIKISENEAIGYVCPFYPKYAVVLPLKFNSPKLLFSLFCSLFGVSCGFYFIYIRIKMGGYFDFSN